MLTSLRTRASALAVGALFAFSTPLAAQDDAESSSGISVSANAALVSEYRFRGVDLSGGDIAILNATVPGSDILLTAVGAATLGTSNSAANCRPNTNVPAALFFLRAVSSTPRWKRMRARVMCGGER